MSLVLNPPWIRQAVLDAKAIPLLFRPGKHTGGGRSQIIEFLSYRTKADPKAVVWAVISDKDHYIKVVFSTACTDRFEKTNDQNLTQMRGGVIIVNRCVLRYRNASKGSPPELYLDIRRFTVMGTEENSTFGEPRDFTMDNEVHRKIRQIMDAKMLRRRERAVQLENQRRRTDQRHQEYEMFVISDHDRRISPAQQALLDKCPGWDKPSVPRPVVVSQPSAFLSQFPHTAQVSSLLTDEGNVQESRIPVSRERRETFLVPSPCVRPRPHPKPCSPTKSQLRHTADHLKNDSGDESAKESDTTSLYSIRTRRDMCVREDTVEIQVMDSTQGTDSDEEGYGDNGLNTPNAVHDLLWIGESSERSSIGDKARRTKITGANVRSQTRLTQDEKSRATPNPSRNAGTSPGRNSRLNSVDGYGSLDDRENRGELTAQNVSSPRSTVTWSSSGSEYESDESDDEPSSLCAFPLSDPMTRPRYYTQPLDD